MHTHCKAVNPSSKLLLLHADFSHNVSLCTLLAYALLLHTCVGNQPSWCSHGWLQMVHDVSLNAVCVVAQAGWGKCNEPFMAGFCANSCNRCNGGCTDTPPNGQYTCQQQVGTQAAAPLHANLSERYLFVCSFPYCALPVCIAVAVYCP